MTITTVTGDVDRLLGRSHHDPHRVLGAHAHREDDDDGVVIRAFLPAATAATVRVGDVAVPMHRRDPRGLFEAHAPGATLPLDYEIVGRGPARDGRGLEDWWPFRDPYAFAPTLGELDLHLVAEGRHEELARVLGAHARAPRGVAGTGFALWAPNARGVTVVGDFNGWDDRVHPMRSLGGSGVWELFVPGVGPGTRYKYAVHGADGSLRLKADPVASRTERPPANASVVDRSEHEWRDDVWMADRARRRAWREPIAIYEVHAGSWRKGLDWSAFADELADHVVDLGFTHVELMPVMEHPFSGSWGYQVTGFFAPTARFGTPDDFRAFVDVMHRRGIGVLLDWVPAHFPRDDWALARFDGTRLYEHEDPRRGEHPDWGTLIFNFGRTEVRNFLTASALTWLRDYHADGLRVDAVASMLYLDYSRREGEWVANERGGREDLDAIRFLRELNETIHRAAPCVLSVAEESTAWPGVSRPTSGGGLGFGFKWNMGWMHDTLGYFARRPVHRRFHHHELTFSLVYAFSEHFVLPLSHDEVVHGKGSLLAKMPGDRWQQLANLRALYGYMWAHPGKKLLFMGGELAQEREWTDERSLDWHLLDDPGHAGVRDLVRDLNRVYRAEPALWDADDTHEGFTWLVADDADHNVLAFVRWSRGGARPVVCVANLSPVPRHRYRLGLPADAVWEELLDTDSRHYGGSDVGNGGRIATAPVPAHGQDWSADLVLPPLGVLWLAPTAAGA